MDSRISGSIPTFAGPARGDLGTADWTFSGCTGYSRAGQPDGSTWTVTQQGTGGLDGVATGTTAGFPGESFLKLSGMQLTLRGWGGGTGGTEQDPCQVTLSGLGGETVTYTNPAGSSPAQMMVGTTGYGGGPMPLTSNTCANVQLTSTASADVRAAYPLSTGGGITITNLPPPGS